MARDETLMPDSNTIRHRRGSPKCPVVLPFLLPVLLAGAGIAAAAPRLETGELAGAPFAAAVPDRWNGQLLLLAPGFRGEDRPRTVELPINQPSLRRLLEDGWLLATTAYRRNGVVIADAVADLDALRDHLARLHGDPRRVLVEGEGMGGLIAVLLAEREPEPNFGTRSRYAGVVAVGPALHLRESGATLGLSLQPRIPIVFLCPQGQLEGARQYATANVPRELRLRPQLLVVARDGSAAINQAERLLALHTLEDWLDQGRPAGSLVGRDVTRHPSPRPSRVEPLPDAPGFTTRVTAVAVETGGLTLDAQTADFAAAGIGPRAWFEVTTAGGTWRALLGRDFAQVRRGEWLAFTDGEGWMNLGRRGADAASSAGLRPGDRLTIRRYGPDDRGPAPRGPN